jgi:hypothetical protein
MESECREEGFWTKISRRIHVVLKDLKKDSVASNPVEPVDCCNPPIPKRTVEKSKGGGTR